MKNIKFEYGHTDVLRLLIESLYFSEDNNGKLSDPPKEYLTLNDDDLYYHVLTGLNYGIKLRNHNLIDGSMEFNMIENENNNTIDLIPTSKYCVKTKTIDDQDNENVSGQKEKYSFY